MRKLNRLLKGRQSEIAKTVADALRATLSPEEEDGLAIKPTKNTDAYLAYLLGKQSMAKLDSVALEKAVDYFRQAIELDPNFALAYVAIADTLHIHQFVAGSSMDEMVVKSELAINKALELDDRLGEAYASLGLLNKTIDPANAEAAFKRALELAPNYASAHQWYSDLPPRYRTPS